MEVARPWYIIILRSGDLFPVQIIEIKHEEVRNHLALCYQSTALHVEENG